MRRELIVSLLLFLPIAMIAQSKVTVAPTIQKYIGDVSELSRNKYFNMHAGPTSSSVSDEEFEEYTTVLNGGYGRGFWGPFSWAKNKTGTRGSYFNESQAKSNGQNQISYNKSQKNYWRTSRQFIVTEHPYNVVQWDIDVQEAADWAALYFEYFYTDEDRPMFYEPMNEPFVHAGDDDFKDQQPDDAKMRQRMAEWFGAIGKKFHETPALSEVKVVGYSSAWPSFELWDFEHWNSRMKMFMDVAGEYMDAFATHLYDGINITGSDSKRSGSNSEAILDLIENYSYIKWGIVKPHAITEFGGIEKGYGDEYSDVKSIQSIKSINHILFNLLDRENNLEIAIPFIGDKALWHINAGNGYQPYGSVLWRPKVIGVPVNDDTEWVYTPRVYFYQLWSDVKGARVYNEANNPDIQTQAFVDGKTMYIALSNLDDYNQDVSLNIEGGTENVLSVRKKSLKIWTKEDPVYTDEELASVPDKITLIPNETVVLAYTFNDDVMYDNQVRYTKYYSLTYLQAIQGRLRYQFNGIDVSATDGVAKLRVSIGRKHSQSKRPYVIVNNTKIDVPDNWAGYDQAGRDDFFGMIEIPVPYELLQENNKIDIQFPDAGGRISSVVLQVGTFTKETKVNVGDVFINNGVKVYPSIIKNGKLTIETNMLDDYHTASIYNLTGRKMLQSDLIDGKAELSNMGLNHGMYLLKVEGPNAISTHKIMVN